MDAENGSQMLSQFSDAHYERMIGVGLSLEARGDLPQNTGGADA